MRLSNKLFLLMVAILLVNLLLLMTFGNTFLSTFYLKRTEHELNINAIAVSSLYNNGKDDELSALVAELEAQNINMLITDEDRQSVVYFSRPLKEVPKEGEGDIAVTVAPSHKDDRLFNLLEILKDTEFSQTPIIIGGDFFGTNATLPLAAVTKLYDGNLLLLETPRVQIESSAKLALVYTFYTSLMTLLIGGAIVFYLSRKATNPILKIQRVAENISKMDFSEKCNVNSNDELGILADSINNMSDKLKENMEQLMRANEGLKIDLERSKETERIRKQFIANVSHDFKTPLTLILNYAHNIQTGGGNKDEQAEIIINEAEKMNSLIHQLLKLSQLESGMLEAEMSFFAIDEVISHVITNYKILSDKKGLEVKYVPSKEIVVGDYNKINQVFTNLFENACMHSDAMVRVYTKKIKNILKISVFNTGKPIDDENLKNLFVSFYKGDKSRKRTGSYGLGLAIVKAILDMHQMKYGAENKKDGVEFWFELEIKKL